MIQKTLRPIYDRDSYSKNIIMQIEYELYYLIYKPLLNILEGIDNSRQSAKQDALISAFKSRKIYYEDGYIYGTFSSTISKGLIGVGGKYNKTKKAFKISLSAFPQDIRSAIAHSGVEDSARIEALKKETKSLKFLPIPRFSFQSVIDKTLQDLGVQFKKVTPKSIEIPLELDDYARNRITEDYTDNINTFVDNWSSEAVERLRLKVEEQTVQGFRADKMAAIIQSEYGITKKRAKFIARQETSLLVSKYRQVRYEQAGINQYRWSTSQDERVRKDHRDLNNRIFSWDSPPIVDKATGRKAHPGEDFMCRCVALPIFKEAG